MRCSPPGVTVAISLLALLVVPVPALRSMGLAGMLIPLVSVSAVLTLLPALLSSIGPRVDYPRIRKEGTASRGWSAWARLIVRHRVVATAVAVVMLALLIIPVFSLKIGQVEHRRRWRAAARDTTRCRPSTDGGVGTGVLTPIEVLVPASDAQAAAEAARRRRRRPAGRRRHHQRRQRRRRRPAHRRHRGQRRHGRGRRRPGGGRGRRRRRRRRHRSSAPASRTTSARSTTSSPTCWR